MISAPTSANCPSTNPSRNVKTRPPTRSRASSTTTSWPAACISVAATRPDSPAPTTSTFTPAALPSSRGLGYSEAFRAFGWSAQGRPCVRLIPHVWVAVSMGGCTTDGTGFFQKLRQRFGWRPPAECLTRSFVELVSHVVQFSLGDASQGMAFREVLPEKSVGVLVGATLPGTAGVTEVDGNPGVDCEPLVLDHLMTLVPGQRATQAGRQLDDAGSDAFAHCVGANRASGQGKQHHVAGTPLDQGADCGGWGSEQKVTLPMSRHSPVLYLRRTLTDHDRVGDLASRRRVHLVLCSTVGPLGSQTLGQLFAQGAAALDIERDVDGLWRDLHQRVVRILPLQPSRDLLRRPPPLQPDC